MDKLKSSDINFSDSAINHFSKVLKKRGYGEGIRLGVKEAGCSGYEYTFDFVDKNTPSLRDFYQEEVITDEILNCEYEGILGPVAGTIGTMLANEVLKKILKIGQNLNGFILIIDLLNLSFRKVKLNKTKKSENKKSNK